MSNGWPSDLEQELGANACFYDKWYEGQLARPNLDELLEEVYRERSNLVVAFVCEAYDKKLWCGIEWRQIKERAHVDGGANVMYVPAGLGGGVRNNRAGRLRGRARPTGRRSGTSDCRTAAGRQSDNPSPLRVITPG